MMTIRGAAERGHVQMGWLDTQHSFSFGHYHDPAQMGFRALRVINEDRVRPGTGFDTHPHRDMEILTYVLSGAVRHEDSMGHATYIRPGEVQRMTAGTGVTHSEWNASDSEPLHLLQIWIRPERNGLPPGYEQRAFPAAEREGRLRLIASRDGRDGSLTVHQDAALYGALLSPTAAVSHPLAPGRHAWVQVARGALEVNGRRLAAGDGAGLSAVDAVTLHTPADAGAAAEVLLFDLA